MKPQEVFDTVAKHLITQGKPSRSPLGGLCYYRDPNGLKCAVGVLIPDDMYKSRMENRDVYDLLEGFPQLKPILDQHKVLLKDLQIVHDGYELMDLPARTFNMPRLKDRLKEVARTYGLNAEAAR